MKTSTHLSRIVILSILLLAVICTFGIKLMQMQVVQGAEYERIVQSGWSTTQTVKAARGEILDRYGRPLAINRRGLDVTLDKAFLPKDQQNEIILRLIHIMEESGEKWIDNLPITETAPFAFKEGYDSEVGRLKTHLKLAPFATIEDTVYWMQSEKYQLESYSDVDMRKIAGVRYEMDQRGFSYSTPYTFATDISMETVAKIKENSFELPGVNVVENTIREYVSKDVAPHLIGEIGSIFREEKDTYLSKGYSLSDKVGKSGIEQAFEDDLRGVDGEREILFNARGDVIDVVDKTAPKPGNTVVTTLDKNLQRITQESLERQIKNLQQTAPPGKGKEADVGAAAVIDIKSGDVLALASYPGYDLSDYDYSALINDPLNPLFNRALMGIYQPGSTFKPIVATAALNEGLMTPTSTVLCNHVYSFFPSYPATCLGWHGAINVYDAIQYSCNIYFYDVGRRLGIDTLHKYATYYGVGQPTGIQIPEKKGQMSSPELSKKLGKRWEGGDIIQSSIGQLDTGITPLQLANYAATIANNGNRNRVNIVKSIKSYNFDGTIRDIEPEIVDTIPAEEWVFDVVTDAMVKTSRTGSASAYFGNYPMDVASKTGTPETNDHPNSTFIAFAPADDPQIAVAIVIEKGWHGYTGAPVARDIFNQYFFADASSIEQSRYGELLQ